MSNRGHGIADHVFGQDHDHDHGPGMFDHDHDHEFVNEHAGPPRTEFISLGIDIGSSSTQAVFSRLTTASGHDADGGVGEGLGGWQRETLYLSPISATPFEADGRIDTTRLRAIITRAFDAAGQSPDTVDTGVLILTGEAARRENAREIAAEAASLGGLVCAASGHHMEARLAAYGSGAVAASRGGRRILAVDIGGATTKFALIEDGTVLRTAALPAGGRLAVIDQANRLVRLDPAGAIFARLCGLDWQPGAVIDPADRKVLAEAMAASIRRAATDRLSPDLDPLWLTAPLGAPGPIDGIMLSGGVGEYVHHRETRDFGDLGRELGHAVARDLASGAFGASILPPGECIRATVLGAAEHSLHLSGDTIHISNHRELLPRRQLPLIAPPCDLSVEHPDPETIGAAIAAHLAAFDLTADPTRPVGLAFRWQGDPSYDRVLGLAQGIAIGMAPRLAARTPLYVLIDDDLAQTLGRVLGDELKISSELMVLDGIRTGDFAWAEFGRVRLPSNIVPVTIRSLVFDDIS